MKNLPFTLMFLLATLAFAGPYDIAEFSSNDVGTPDAYIAAEFGGELAVADPSAVTDIQEGRLFVRQKFDDPFGEEPTTYQLYQGQTGEQFSTLTPLEAEGVDYTKLVKAKFYEKRGMAADQDVAKVYFDGKSIFAENMTSLIAFVDGSQVMLKAATPQEDTTAAAAPVAAPKDPYADDEDEWCDDDDPDCEDDEDLYAYDVSGNLDSSNAAADDYEYSTTAARDAASARFGIGDEVRFWTAVGLSVVAAGAAVVGVLQHMKYNEAKDAYDAQGDLIEQVEEAVASVCATSSSADCEAAMDWYLQENAIDLSNGNSETALTLSELKSRRSTNKSTMDSYSTARNIWFGVTAATLAASIVLFVW